MRLPTSHRIAMLFQPASGFQPVALLRAASLCVWVGLLAAACGDDSPGGGGSGGGGGTAGAGGVPDCGECFRAIDCVETCGGEVLQSGCCPCPEGTFDDLECSADGGGGA